MNHTPPNSHPKLVSAGVIAQARGISAPSAGRALKKYCNDLKQGELWPFKECMERLDAYNKSHYNTPSVKFNSENDTETSKIGHSYEEAKRLLINVQLQQEHIKLHQLKDGLLNKAEVQREYFSHFRTLRDAILAVPDRLSAQLVGADEIKIRNEMNIELRKALEQAAQLSFIEDKH